MQQYRYKLVLEYDGKDFFGWQICKRLPTIQGAVLKAAQHLLQVGSLVAAGRTDARVHALGQVIHIDSLTYREPTVLKRALNHFLAEQGISVLSCEQVDDNFHARFSAKSRSYCYKLISRKSPLTHQRHYYGYTHFALDLSLLQQAANYLLGHQDFTSFRSAGCQAKNSFTTITQATWQEVTSSCATIEQEQELHFNVTARSFLYHQVRNMVGTMLKVGRGLISPDQFLEILRQKDRSLAGAMAMPNGLYLQKVEY